MHFIVRGFRIIFTRCLLNDIVSNSGYIALDDTQLDDNQ
jgi:hypothetical protein